MRVITFGFSTLPRPTHQDQFLQQKTAPHSSSKLRKTHSDGESETSRDSRVHFPRAGWFGPPNLQPRTWNETRAELTRTSETITRRTKLQSATTGNPQVMAVRRAISFIVQRDETPPKFFAPSVEAAFPSSRGSIVLS